MDKSEKTELVARLNRLFNEVSVVVVTRNHGLTVAQVTDLRNRMCAGGASFKVTKNRLARIALEGTPFVGIGDMLVGPTALATSADPVAAAKIAIEFAKTTDRFAVIGAGMGATILDQGGVKALSELPSLDELRAKIIGIVQAPATKVASIVQAPAGKLARVFAAYGDPERQAA